MPKKLPEFPAESYEQKILPELVKMSEDTLDRALCREITDFLKSGPHEAHEVYAFCDHLGQAAFHGRASAFVMKLCAVQRFYTAPKDTKLKNECGACGGAHNDG
jgi:hypothetical protein